jgi:hypothetical protein
MNLDGSFRCRPDPAGVCFAVTAVIALFAAGCSLVRTSPSPQLPAEVAVVEKAEFTLADNMNDVWNTVGQILVRLPGVTYESRAQMLGIYALRYRDESLLIRTQAVALRDRNDRVLTRIVVLQPDGRPTGSKAALELLNLLEQRLPAEIDKYRTPIRLKKKRGASQRSSKGSLSGLPSHCFASDGASLRVVITGQALASSALRATNCSCPAGTSSSG